MSTPEGSPRPPRSWLPARADVLIAGGVAVPAAAVVVATGAFTARPSLGIVPAAVLAAVVTSTPLLRARTWPVVAAAALAVVFHLAGSPYGPKLGTGVLSAEQADAWQVAAILAYCLGTVALVYLAARHRPPWLVVATIAAVQVPVNVLAVGSGLSWAVCAAGAGAGMLIVAVASSPLWVIGGVRRRNALRTARQAEQNAALVARAVDEERARIARELQALVLADLAVIADRAGRADLTDDELRAALTEIVATGRGTLTAMRRLLGMLRHGDADVRDPQPSLDRLDDLVGGLREQGMTVAVAVSGTARTPAAEVDLAAYRLLQEALSNAGRDTPLDLRVAYEPDAIRLTVDGDIAGAGGAAAREWVRLVGGELRLGRGHGPALDVRLPERRKGAVWPSAS